MSFSILDNQTLYFTLRKINAANDSDDLIHMGIAALNADRLGCALAFFKLAEKVKHPNARQFIQQVRTLY